MPHDLVTSKTRGSGAMGGISHAALRGGQGDATLQARVAAVLSDPEVACRVRSRLARRASIGAGSGPGDVAPLRMGDLPVDPSDRSDRAASTVLLPRNEISPEHGPKKGA